jgi:hypothetical protein
MQLQPVICSWDPRVDVVGIEDGSLLVLMIEAPHPFILISGFLSTYIMQFSTCYSGYRS